MNIEVRTVDSGRIQHTSGDSGLSLPGGSDAHILQRWDNPPAPIEPGIPEPEELHTNGVAVIVNMLMNLRPEASATLVNLAFAVFLVSGVNVAFWQAFSHKLGLQSAAHWAFLGLTAVAMCMIFNIFLSLLSCKPFHKPAIVLLLFIAATASYFMQNYGIIIDNQMITNLLETDVREASEQLTWSLFSHFFILGVIPSVLLLVTRVRYRPWRPELLVRGGVILCSSFLLLAVVMSGYKQIALFGRENRDLRMYINPTYPIYSVIKTIRKNLHPNKGEALRVIASDATRPANPKTAIVLVVGETARSREFSLNGYPRNTNPELSTQDVSSFTDVQSCGTSTAESVPCMFSHLERVDYSRSEAGKYENILDVLQRAGVEVIWRDNNSGSKGVADRVEYEDLSNAGEKGLCPSGECYDEILLKGLDQILKRNRGNMLVVLHQKGSHGPSYYKRVPKEFETFLPQCTQDNVQDCAPQSIVNAYDNTIRYTDHVLAEVIDLLKSQKYSTAMLYVSDHGESLGEKNIYLHGLPYAIAPKEQTTVPMIFWGSPSFLKEQGITPAAIKANLHTPLSHDNLFHTLLGLFHVRTQAYRPELDAGRLWKGMGATPLVSGR